MFGGRNNFALGDQSNEAIALVVVEEKAYDVMTVVRVDSEKARLLGRAILN